MVKRLIVQFYLHGIYLHRCSLHDSLGGDFFCVKVTEKNNALYIILELILSGYTAEISPTLASFPFSGFLNFTVYSMNGGTLFRHNVKVVKIGRSFAQGRV